MVQMTKYSMVKKFKLSVSAFSELFIIITII